MTGRADKSGAAVAPWARPRGIAGGSRAARCLAWCVGALLLCSATLKALATFDASPLASGIGAIGRAGTPQVLVLAICTVECTLAGWLISGWHPQGAWIAATLVFGAFLAISAHAVWVGASSCGCFGRLPVPPVGSGILDLAVLVGLAATWPGYLHPVPNQIWFRAAMRLTLAAVGAAFGLLANVYVPSFSMALELVRQAQVIVVDPTEWPGRRWGLLEYIDIGSELNIGKWQVIMVHHDCLACRQLVGNLTGFRYDNAIDCVALVELPPYNVDGWLAESPVRHRGRLRDDVFWVMSTPLIVVLRDGIVTELFTSILESKVLPQSLEVEQNGQ